VSEKQEPQLRVIDRRWWARQEPSEDADPQPVEHRSKPTYVEELERQLAERSAEIQNYAIEHRRALEEFEQARTRIRRDVSKEVERGRRAVLAEMLDVLDNIDRAIAAAGDEASSPLHRGVELVRDQFLATLERLGVNKIAALGEPFDATRHDAVSTAPVDDPAQDGRVIAVVKEGYAIGDDLLRPASVVVGAKDLGTGAPGV
jgi:molecular chaperone GrpE